MALFSLFILLFAAIFGVYLRFKRSSYLPWHETSEWQEFLKVYDTLANEQYLSKPSCESKDVDTRFGKTHAFTCGDPLHHAVLLLHGATANAMMFGDWMVPSLLDAGLYAIAIDYPCDVGRSIPPKGDPNNCPQSEREIADWATEVASGLGVKQPFSMVGYSYGCLVAFSTARFYPDNVHKLALLAPAAPFAPLKTSFIVRGILSSVFSSNITQNWFFGYMSSDPNFDINKWKQIDQDHMQTARRVGGTILKVPASPVDDDVLAQVAHRNPTFLVIGEEEKLLNATLAVERAQKAGAQVKVFPKAGHLMLMEHVTDDVVEEVVRFLTQVKAEEAIEIPSME
jgi:pimeloyl-ACP methyl ester carboxylesterase